MDRRRLAGPISPEQSEDLPFFQPKGNPIDSRHRRFARKYFSQFFN
jgi:hypothetical protein